MRAITFHLGATSTDVSVHFIVVASTSIIGHDEAIINDAIHAIGKMAGQAKRETINSQPVKLNLLQEFITSNWK